MARLKKRWGAWSKACSTNFNRYHLSKFIIQVRVKNIERLKYLGVFYNPHEKKVDSYFEWDTRDEEFNLIEEQVSFQKKIPDLKKLEISNKKLD